MIAFEILGRPIYRYWIFYLITFVVGYAFFVFFPRSWFFTKTKEIRQRFQWLYHILKDDLDDIFLVIIVWVMAGGRFWHVFFYERHYYSQNLIEIVKINQGWMSFVGWVIGVVLGLLYLWRKHRLTKEEFILFWDLVLLIVPLWSLLWRIGNGLNQELYGKSIETLALAYPSAAQWIEKLWLVRIYDKIDSIERIDMNTIQSIWEWGILLLLTWSLFLIFYRKDPSIKPWLIAWCYLIGYGILRFFFEYWKELPSYEMRWIYSISQILSFALFILGVLLLVFRWRWQVKSWT